MKFINNFVAGLTPTEAGVMIVVIGILMIVSTFFAFRGNTKPLLQEHSVPDEHIDEYADTSNTQC